MRSFLDLVGFVVIVICFLYTMWDWVYHYYFVIPVYPSSTLMDALIWWVIMFTWVKVTRKTI